MFNECNHLRNKRIVISTVLSTMTEGKPFPKVDPGYS